MSYHEITYKCISCPATFHSPTSQIPFTSFRAFNSNAYICDACNIYPSTIISCYSCLQEIPFYFQAPQCEIDEVLEKMNYLCENCIDYKKTIFYGKSYFNGKIVENDGIFIQKDKLLADYYVRELPRETDC